MLDARSDLKTDLELNKLRKMSKLRHRLSFIGKPTIRAGVELTKEEEKLLIEAGFKASLIGVKKKSKKTEDND